LLVDRRKRLHILKGVKLQRRLGRGLADDLETPFPN
jgi:hypothetical protein